MISVIDTIDKDKLVVPTEERLGVVAIVIVIMNFHSDGIDEYDEMVNTLFGRGSYIYALRNLDLNLKNRVTPPAKPLIKDHPILNLKALPSYL